MPLNLYYPGLKKVHQKPPIYVCEGFLTDEECDAFIRTAGPLLQRSKTHAIAGEHSCALNCYALRNPCLHPAFLPLKPKGAIRNLTSHA